jgi:choline-sulfatase
VSAAAGGTARVYPELAIGLLLGVGAAAIAALPAAVRSAAAGASFLAAWLSLWGSSAALLAPAVGALRIARPLPRSSLSIPAGLVIAAPVLIMLARILKGTTHHRPLGAATFAMLAAAVVLGAIVVAARLISSEHRISRAALWSLLGMTALATAVLALPLARAGGGSVIDALLLLGLGAAAVWVKAPAAAERAARIAGPLALALAVIGGFAARARVGESTRTSAPVLTGPFR